MGGRDALRLVHPVRVSGTIWLAASPLWRADRWWRAPPADLVPPGEGQAFRTLTRRSGSRPIEATGAASRHPTGS
jgi:hypothetical protein